MKVLRAFAFIGMLGISIAAAGCSGQSGGVTPPVTADPSQQTMPMPDSTPAPQPDGVTATAPPITTDATATYSSVPTHVQTGEYLTTSTEVASNPTKYAPYLTYAYAALGRLGATQAAGIKTVLYTSPIMPSTSLYELKSLRYTFPADEAKTCSGSTVTTYGGAGLLSDPAKAAAYRSYFQNMINHYTSVAKSANPGYAQPWNYFFIDNDGPLYKTSATPCDYSVSTWTSGEDAAMTASGQKFILNGLSVAPSSVSTYVNRLAPSSVSGGEFELCFRTALWSSEENSQLQTVALLKREGKMHGPGWWCYVNNTSSYGSSSIPLRQYAYASFLLTYDPNYSVFQESFSTPSTFKVFPETGFVPLQPVSVPASITRLLTSTGAYEQRYNACYYRGRSLGHCEVIVNPSTSSYVSVPNPWGLHHSMVLSGNGVLDGGTASFTGGVPSRMAPKSGLILTP